MWPTDDALDKIEDRQLPALCAVPSSPDRVPRWLRAWSPKDLMNPDAIRAPKPTISDPTVHAAMHDLTLNCNHNNDLTGTEKALTILTFRALQKAGVPWDSEELAAWAASNGWPAATATKLGQMAQDLAAGKDLRIPNGERYEFPDDVVDGWRKQAADGLSDEELTTHG